MSSVCSCPGCYYYRYHGNRLVGERLLPPRPFEGQRFPDIYLYPVPPPGDAPVIYASSNYTGHIPLPPGPAPVISISELPIQHQIQYPEPDNDSELYQYPQTSSSSEHTSVDPKSEFSTGVVLSPSGPVLVTKKQEANQIDISNNTPDILPYSEKSPPPYASLFPGYNIIADVTSPDPATVTPIPDLPSENPVPPLQEPLEKSGDAPIISASEICSRDPNEVIPPPPGPAPVIPISELSQDLIAPWWKPTKVQLQEELEFKEHSTHLVDKL